MTTQIIQSGEDATAAIVGAKPGEMVWLGPGSFEFTVNRYALPVGVCIKGMGKGITKLWSKQRTMFCIQDGNCFADMDIECAPDVRPDSGFDPGFTRFEQYSNRGNAYLDGVTEFTLNCINAIWVNEGNQCLGVVIQNVRATATDMCALLHFDDGNPPYAGIGSLADFTFQNCEFTAKHVGLWLQDDGGKRYNTKILQCLFTIDGRGWPMETTACVFWEGPVSEAVIMGNKFYVSGNPTQSANVCVQHNQGVTYLTGNSYFAGGGGKKVVVNRGTMFLDDVLNANQVMVGRYAHLVEFWREAVKA